VTAWPADHDNNGNASVHDRLDDKIPVGCFLRADNQEYLVLGHMLARMHVLGHVLDCVNALMPNALMLLSMH